MTKLLLTLLMMFTFGTSTVNAETVNAEKNTTSIENRIDELAETKTASQSILKTKVDGLSKGELETIIGNVNELTEPTEDDLIIKEAATSKLKEMKKSEYEHRLNYPRMILFSIVAATLIYFILVKLGLMD